MRRYESPILDESGRRIVVQEPAYRSAGRGRSFHSTLTSSGSINTHLRGSLDTLRYRSRDLLRNSPSVWKGIRTRVAELIGTGVVPRSQWRDKARRAELQTLWSDWIDEADADGRTDGYGLQALIVREALASGECFVRLRRRRAEDGLAVPLQMQALAADFCPSWKCEDLGNGRRIECGIEFDAIGRRAAYHFYRAHPGDPRAQSTELVRVPANEVLHLYEVLEPGQIRGEPSLARIIRMMATRGNYVDATAMRMAIASLFAAFVHRSQDSDPLGTSAGEFDENQQPIFEAGRINYLEPGEEITFPNTPDIGARFVEFLRAIDLDCAAGMDITYEQLTGDLSHVNFSSIRAGLVAFRRAAEQWIHLTLVPAVMRPLWREWIQAAVSSGAIDLPGFATPAGRREAFRCEWQPQAWPWVDPEADVAADNAQIEARTISRRAVIRKRGDDPDEVEREILEEEAADRAAGRVLDPAPTPTVTPADRAAERSRQRRAARRVEVAANA